MLKYGRGKWRSGTRTVSATVATTLIGTSAALLTSAVPATAATPTRDVWVVTAPTTAATTQAVSILRYDAAGASAGSAITLPTAVNGAQRAFTLGGTETTTGVLARSLDGKSVTLAGYAVAPGTSVSSSAVRGVALVDPAGTVDTSTVLTGALNKSAVRGAVTNDGTAFWAAGDGDDASPKRSVVYQPLGATTTPLQIWSSDEDQYKKKGAPIKAYGGSFWFASAEKSALYQVVGPPASPTSATLTTVASSTTPLDFAFVDRDASVPGVDTLYVAVSTGIEKWATSNGTSWTKIGTSALAGTRALDARSAGDRTEIYAVVGTSAANTLHRITDTAAPTAPAVLTDTTIATAAAGNAFRGVAFAPVASGNAPDSTGTAPTVTITPPSGAAVGDTVTYSAAVDASGTPATGGSVTFYDGTTILGTAPVSGAGVAQLSITQSLGGTRSITAWYSGSDDLLPTRSAATPVTVTRMAATTTAAPDSITADYSTATTAVTISVAAAGGGSVVPTGTVTLTENGTTIATGTLVSGSVKLSLTALAAGSHSLVATYGGSDSFAPSSADPVSVTINQAPTTTTITSSSSTIALGSTLNTTVAVANTVNASSTYRPTGTVEVTENGTVVGSGTLSSGSASVLIPAAVLTTGTHTFSARFTSSASANHAGSTAATPLTVNVVSSTVSALTVTPSSGTIYFGQQQVTVSGTVTGLPTGGATPTGTVELRNGATSLAQVPVNASGGFTFTLPADQAAGSYSLVAYYSGGGAYSASQSAAKSLTITQGGATLNTSASLALSAPTAAPGDPIRATATVTNTSNATTPVGFVRFSVDGTVVGDAKLSPASPATTPPTATASFDLDTNLAEGNHTITAKYLGAGTSGSAGFKASDVASATLGLEAAEAVDTTVTVDPPSAGSPVIYGTANTVTIKVAPVEGTKTVTGTVQLRDGGTVIGSGQLTGGALTLSVASLLPGNHELSAAYLATGSFNAGQSTGVVNLNITAASTSTTVTLTTSAVLYGTALKPKITVANTAGTGVVPTGSVSIVEGSTVLATGNLVSGVATLTLPTTLASGSHTLHAVYTPTGGFAASESATNPTATVVGTSITSTSFNPNEYYIGTARPTITFTVSSLQPGRGIPTGTVAVYTTSSASTAALLGYGTLDAAGKVTITLSADVPRSGGSLDDDKIEYKSITASYSGAGTANPIEDISATVGGGGGGDDDDDDDDEGTLEIKFKGSPVATTATLGLGSSSLAPGETTTAHVEVTSASSAPTGGYVQILVDPTAYGTPTTLMPACFTAAYCQEVPVSGGAANVTLPVLAAGDHTVTARYLPYQATKSSTYYGSSTVDAASTASVHVDETKGSVQVGVSGPNVEVGANSLATVTVTGSASVPQGSVEIFEGTTSLGTAELTNGEAQVDLGQLPVGLHPLKAKYSGSAKYDAADSQPVQHSVFGHGTGLTATPPATCTYGIACGVTLQVTTGTGTPTGTVRLLENGSQIASSSYTGTAVTLNAPATWPVGTHDLTAVFSPTSDHTAASADVTVVVGKAVPAVELSLAKTSTAYHAAVQASVKVTATGAVPGGAVTIQEGTQVLATITLAGGTGSASLPATLAVGKHALTASYAATTSFQAASSTAKQLTVTKAATTSKLKLSRTTTSTKGSVTLTATVSASGFTLTGTVRFYDGTKLLGKATLKNGKATYKLAKLKAGKHKVTVKYAASTNAGASTSAAATVKVK